MTSLTSSDFGAEREQRELVGAGEDLGQWRVLPTNPRFPASSASSASALFCEPDSAIASAAAEDVGEEGLAHDLLVVLQRAQQQHHLQIVVEHLAVHETEHLLEMKSQFSILH